MQHMPTATATSAVAASSTSAEFAAAVGCCRAKVSCAKPLLNCACPSCLQIHWYVTHHFHQL
jgi:hypothetical protein